MFELSASITADEFNEQTNARDVRFGSRGGQTFRAVTHRMIDMTDIDEALNRTEVCMKNIRQEGK